MVAANAHDVSFEDPVISTQRTIHTKAKDGVWYASIDDYAVILGGVGRIGIACIARSALGWAFLSDLQCADCLSQEDDHRLLNQASVAGRQNTTAQRTIIIEIPRNAVRGARWKIVLPSHIPSA